MDSGAIVAQNSNKYYNCLPRGVKMKPLPYVSSEIKNVN
jgi:hypothetical protein